MMSLYPGLLEQILSNIELLSQCSVPDNDRERADSAGLLDLCKTKLSLEIAKINGSDNEEEERRRRFRRRRGSTGAIPDRKLLKELSDQTLDSVSEAFDDDSETATAFERRSSLSRRLSVQNAERRASFSRAEGSTSPPTTVNLSRKARKTNKRKSRTPQFIKQLNERKGILEDKLRKGILEDDEEGHPTSEVGSRKLSVHRTTHKRKISTPGAVAERIRRASGNMNTVEFPPSKVVPDAEAEVTMIDLEEPDDQHHDLPAALLQQGAGQDPQQSSRRMPSSGKFWSKVQISSDRFTGLMRHGSTAELTKGEKHLVRNAFDALDQNGDGGLSPEELFMVLTCMGIMPSTAELHHLMTEYDADNDGEIKFDEFTEMMKRFKKRHMLTEDSMTKRLSSITSIVSKVHNFNTQRDVIGDSKYMLHPEDAFNGIWDVLITALVGLTMLTIPLSLAFEEFSDTTWQFSICVDGLFLLDVVKNFNVGFVNDDNDAVIMDRRIVASAYLTSWFLPDFVSSIPVQGIIKIMESNTGSTSQQYASTSKTMKLLRLLRIAKLFRLLRANKVFRQLRMFFQYVADELEYDVLSSYAVFNLGRLFCILLVTAHWIGCLNFMLCRMYEFPAESWVVRAGLHRVLPSGEVQSAPLWSQYNWSFFKALLLMITIGFQDPPIGASHCTAPIIQLSETALGGVEAGSVVSWDSAHHVRAQPSEWCVVESWATLISLYVGVIFNAVVISEVSSIVIFVNKGRQHHEQKMHKANSYMALHRLPYEIRDKVRNFFNIQRENMFVFDETDLLRELPPSIRKQILLHNTNTLMQTVPVLKTAPKILQAAASEVIHPVVAFAEETIFEMDTRGVECFFIYSGVIEIRNPMLRENDGVVAALSNGCYFGEVAILQNVKRTARAMANSLCILYSLQQDDLRAMLDDCPDEKEYMSMVAKYRLLRMQHIEETGEHYAETKCNARARGEASAAANLSNLVDGDFVEKYMLADPEDSKTELLMMSGMLGKYEKFVLGGKNKAPPPVFFNKRKDQSECEADSVAFHAKEVRKNMEKGVRIVGTNVGPSEKALRLLGVANEAQLVSMDSALKKTRIGSMRGAIIKMNSQTNLRLRSTSFRNRAKLPS